MAQMRLDRILTELQQGSRTQVKQLIRKGMALVNGVCVTNPEYKCDPENTELICRGKRLHYQSFVYYLLNKPAGVITATEDRRHRTVMELLPEQRKGVFPVGRLDRDTEGLLLLTNDGELAHRLLSPRHHVDKVYYVETDRPIPAAARERMERGLCLEDGTETMPARLELLEEKKAHLTIQEGKFHQVKRMFEAVGVSVVYLQRIAMGPLSLQESGLAVGEARELTNEELLKLRKAMEKENSFI